MSEERFLATGLDKNVVKGILKNADLTKGFSEVLDEAGITQCSKSIGALLYSMTTRFPPQAPSDLRKTLAKYIVEEKVKSNDQLTAALDHLKQLGLKEIEFDAAAFEESCGVGVEISKEDIKKVVSDLIEIDREELLKVRYRNNMLLKVRQKIRWADVGLVKAELDGQLLTLLGPKTDADKGKKKKEKKEKKAPMSAQKAEEPVAETERRFNQPWENDLNKKDILESHLERTGRKVRTRFPPEPNGYLHIGHAKAMNLDFGYAKDMGGTCVLRFDDTNPEAEKQEYIDSIIECCEWLGHKPNKVTYSSDYFQKLYDLAVQLIKDGHAYVDHSSAAEIAEQREKRQNSQWRDRPIEESLRLFEDMKHGKFAEGEATLRLKMDMQNDNPCMRDLIAYRIKYKPHPHAGDGWCIYPSYDYTHCTVDSLEDITHSLCTLEFEIRRDSYYWLLDAMKIYKPVVWEFSRLNITNTVVSKRKLQKLIQEGICEGWDDPRLYTLQALRRRGFTPQGINTFCKEIGVSRGDQVISVKKLEHCVRADLDATSPRVMAVLDPLKVVITSYPADKVEMRTLQNHPKNPSMGTRQVPFSRVIYIDRSDFRLEDEKNFFGLAPDKEVGLRFAFNITCTGVKKDAEGNVIELEATHDPDNTRKPKGHLHWVAEPTPGTKPQTATVKLYEPLFTVEQPDALGKDWLTAVNPNSMTILTNAVIEPMTEAKSSQRFQFERMGYFCVDYADFTPGQPSFIRTLPLREGKK